MHFEKSMMYFMYSIICDYLNEVSKMQLFSNDKMENYIKYFHVCYLFNPPNILLKKIEQCVLTAF